MWRERYRDQMAYFDSILTSCRRILDHFSEEINYVIVSRFHEDLFQYIKNGNWNQKYNNSKLIV